MGSILLISLGVLLVTHVSYPLRYPLFLSLVRPSRRAGWGLRRLCGRNRSVRLMAYANANRRVPPNMNADRTCEPLSLAFGGTSPTRKARRRALGVIGSREVPGALRGSNRIHVASTNRAMRFMSRVPSASSAQLQARALQGRVAKRHHRRPRRCPFETPSRESLAVACPTSAAMPGGRCRRSR